MYGPGYLDEQGCDLQNSAELTGIQLSISDKKDFIQVDITNSGHVLAQGLENLSYGSDIDPSFFTDDIVWMPFNTNTEDYQFTPIFFANDPDAEVIGHLKAIDQPGLVYKDLGSRKSVYSSAPLLQPNLIRNILEQAGVHIYSKGNDLIYANDTYVSLTAYASGNRLLQLPKDQKITDALNGQVLAENSDRITFDAQQYETRIFKLG